MSENTAERIAQAFHEAYERLAPQFSYTTRKRSAVPWEDVPADNKALMVATVNSLLDEGLIVATAEVADLRQAVGLLNSMVKSGEDHSDVSTAVVRKALEVTRA